MLSDTEGQTLQGGPDRRPPRQWSGSQTRTAGGGLQVPGAGRTGGSVPNGDSSGCARGEGFRRRVAVIFHNNVKALTAPELYTLKWSEWPVGCYA